MHVNVLYCTILMIVDMLWRIAPLVDVDRGAYKRKLTVLYYTLCAGAKLICVAMWSLCTYI